MSRSVIALYLALCVVLLTATVTTASSEQKQKISTSETQAVTSAAETYTLKDYNGRIALYVDQDTKPTEIYNIFTNSLPEADITELRHGISVHTRQELEKLLEDYIS